MNREGILLTCEQSDRCGLQSGGRGPLTLRGRPRNLTQPLPAPVCVPLALANCLPDGRWGGTHMQPTNVPL
jgi:hypothetical protein